MIQRIQSLWLLISAISSLFMMSGGIINYIDKAGQKYFTAFQGTFRLTSSGSELITGSVSLSSLIIIIPLLSVITILLYKSRRLQKVFSLVLVSFSTCLIIVLVYYSFLLIKSSGADPVPGVKMVLPVLILITTVLAYRGISADEKLIKSYDRLR